MPLVFVITKRCVITDHGFAPVQLLEGLTANRAVRGMFALQYVLETELVQQKGLCFSSVHFQKWVNAAIKVDVLEAAHEMSKRDLVTGNY